MSRETAVRTPGPWSAQGGARIEGNFSHGGMHGGFSEFVAACVDPLAAREYTLRSDRLAQSDANAAFIVKACNSFEALVEALKPLASIPVEEFGWDKNPDRRVHGWNGFELYTRDVLAARAALALATKDQP